MPGPPKLRRRQTQLGVCDQALSSGSNFLILLLVAQGATVSNFGWFTVMFGVVATSVGVTRTGLGVPIATEIQSNSRKYHQLVQISSSLALAIGAVGALVVAPMAFFVGGDVGSWALVVAVGLPIITLQDLWRFVAVVDGHAGRAVISDALWFSVGLGLWASVLAGPTSPTPTQVISSWVFGGVLALTYLAISGAAARPKVAGIWPILKDARRAHLTLDALLGAVAAAVLPALVAVAATPAVTGTWRGATTLMSPLNVLLAAVPMVYLRRIAQLDADEARRMCGRIGGGLALLAMSWALMLLFIPDQMGHVAMGPTWPGAHALIPIVALETAAVAFWTVGINWLRSQQMTSLALIWRVAYASLSLTSGLTAALIWGSAAYVATALSICALVIAGTMWFSIGKMSLSPTRR